MNVDHLVLGSQLNLPLAIPMKGFVSSPVIGKMIIVVTHCAATLVIAPNIGAKAYAQENNTLILEDMRAIMRDEQRDIASIRIHHLQRLRL
jgi:hypothetical protein